MKNFDTQFRDWVEELASRPKAALTETKALLREMRVLDHEHLGTADCCGV